MSSNVFDSAQSTKVIAALCFGIASALLPGRVSKAMLLGGAAALLATIGVKYGQNAPPGQRGDSPHWRTIKTYRVSV